MAHPAPAGGQGSPLFTGNLQEAAASPGGLPKALAISAHVAPFCGSLLLGDDLPGRDAGKDQAALGLAPKEVAILAGAWVVLLAPVFANN